MFKLFIALAGSRAFAALLLLITNLLFARWAGPEDFGATFIVISFSTFMFTALDFGMSSYIIRSAARLDDERTRGALRLNAWTSTLGAVFISAVILLVAPFFGYSNWLAILGAALALEKSADTMLGIYIARNSKRTIFAATVTRRFTTLLLFIILFLVEINPTIAYSFSFFVGTATTWILVRISLSKTFITGTYLSINKLTKESVPFFLANISAGARNLDVALVGAIGNTFMAGLWSGAQKLTTPFMLVSGALASAVLPAASRGKTSDIRKLTKRVTLLHIFLSIALLPIGLFSEEILLLALGSQYVSAAPILFWMLLAYPMIALSSTLGGILQGHDDERFVARNGVIFAILLVAGLTICIQIINAHFAATYLFLLYVAKSLFLAKRLIKKTN